MYQITLKIKMKGALFMPYFMDIPKKTNDYCLIDSANYSSKLDHTQLLLEVGQHCLELGNPDAALAYLDKAFEVVLPEKSSIYHSILYYKGITLHELGKYQEALDCYDLAIKANDKDLCTQMQRCETLFKLSRYHETLKECDRINRNSHIGLNGCMDELKDKTIYALMEHFFNQSEYTGDYKFDGTRLIKLTVDNIKLDGRGINTFTIEPKYLPQSETQLNNIILNLDEIIYILENKDNITILTNSSDIYISKMNCNIISRKRTITVKQLFQYYKSVSDDEDSIEYLKMAFQDYNLNANDLIFIFPITWYNPREEINSYWADFDEYTNIPHRYVPGMYEVRLWDVTYKRPWDEVLGYALKK